MNDTRRAVAQLALLTAAAWIAACQQPASQTGVANAPPTLESQDAAALPSDTTLGAAAGDSPGKPLPPIDFRYELLGVPAVGQPLEIRVSSNAQAALDALNVALSGNERVQVPAALARFRMARTTASAPMTRTISVTPLASGTLYLDVLVEADIGGRRQSRAVTIPIRVGAESPPSETEGSRTTDADGRPIISLPASEG